MSLCCQVKVAPQLTSSLAGTKQLWQLGCICLRISISHNIGISNLYIMFEIYWNSTFYLLFTNDRLHTQHWYISCIFMSAQSGHQHNHFFQTFRSQFHGICVHHGDCQMFVELSVHSWALTFSFPGHLNGQHKDGQVQGIAKVDWPIQSCSFKIVKIGIPWSWRSLPEILATTRIISFSQGMKCQHNKYYRCS